LNIRWYQALFALVLFFVAARAGAAAAPPPDCAKAVSPSSLFFVTDRERATDEQLFTGERAPGGEGVAALTSGVLQAPISAQSLTTCASFSSFLKALAPRFDKKRGRQVLIFVHGYFTPFRDAMETAEKLQAALSFPGPVIAFSWPARRTSQLAYGTDEKNAGWAMAHFRLLLDDLQRTYPGIPISLAVHSLGSRFMTYGIKTLGRRGCTTCFGRGLAFAPDENVDDLREALEDVGTCRGKPPVAPAHAAPLTVYVSNEDRALRASQKFHGGDQRAGQAGSKMLLCAGVDTIDVGYYKSSDKVGHSYLLDPPITFDARLALAGVSPLAPARKLKQVTRPGGVYYELR
jgi:esterase/lipase superfamily enzyme